MTSYYILNLAVCMSYSLTSFCIKFDNADDDGEKAETSSDKLQHMGFSIEHVQNASAKCSTCLDFQRSFMSHFK